MGFKENLKSELEYKGMMVKELALRTGVNRQSLDNYLSTHSTMPSAEVAVKIAQALGTTVEYLVTGKQSEQDYSSESADICSLIKQYKSLPAEKQKALLQIALVM